MDKTVKNFVICQGCGQKLLGSAICQKCENQRDDEEVAYQDLLQSILEIVREKLIFPVQQTDRKLKKNEPKK